jgi:hypothetical protein
VAATVHNIYGELEQRLNKTLTQRFPELTFANGVDIPTTTDLEAGADAVSVDVVTGYGQAGLLGAESSDIPLVQVNVGKDLAPVVMAVAGYAVGFKTDRAYSFSGKSAIVTDRSVLMVRRAIDERLHFYAAYGDPGLGTRGLINSANVTPTTPAFNPNTADFATWVSFLMDLILGMGMSTNGLTIPTDVLIPPNMMRRAAGVANAGGDMNVLSTVRERLDAIDGYQQVAIRSRPEVSSAMLFAKGVRGSDTLDRIVIYRKDPMAVARQVESTLAQLMPQKYVFADPKASVVYPMFSCATATQIYETNSISYIDVAKTT